MTDSLEISAGAAGPAAFFPQSFPIPEAGRYLNRQLEPELMREHTDLPAMVSFVSEHVTEHFRANRPRLSPAVPAKLFDAAPIGAERFGEHLGAAGGAPGQCRASLPRRAARAVELEGDLQVRSRQPDPLRADVVHVGEDCGNGADGVVAWVPGGRAGSGLCCRFRSPGGRVEMFDEKLVHAVVGEKDESIAVHNAANYTLADTWKSQSAPG